MEENVLYKLPASDLKIIEDATERLYADFQDYVSNELISIYSLLCLVEELTDKIDNLNLELNEMENRYLYPEDYDDTDDRYIDEYILSQL